MGRTGRVQGNKRKTKTPRKKMENKNFERKNLTKPDHTLSAIELIYNSSKSRILRVADKISNGLLLETPDHGEQKEVVIPEKHIWGFKLGDNVKIKYSIEEFKSIQKRTLGWNSRLSMLHGHIGIVTGILSQYDNSVSLFFPNVFSECSLYAGVLEVVERADFPSQWKVNDLIETEADKRLVILLQQGLGLIPPQFLGEKGRVIAITKRSVEVTFDEETSTHVHPALLKPSKDKNEIRKKERNHPRGFQVGEKVKMIANMKSLIKNQNGFGGWSNDMILLRGKEVTILNIQEDNSLNVQPKHHRAWRVNHESALKMDEKEKYLPDLDLLPSDVVKIIIPRNIHSWLSEKNIPSSFIEYLRLASRIGHVSDDFDYTTEFFNDKYIQICPELLRKASDTQTKKHRDVQERVDALKPGDTVHLDVGPPNYVRDILAAKRHPSVVNALTKSSTLLGFIDKETVVIQYENGQRYKINKKYFTVPERFDIEKEKCEIDLNTFSYIRDMLSKSVSEIHKNDSVYENDWKVKIIRMSVGDPPNVDFHIVSMLATHDLVVNWLRENTSWDVEDTCVGELFVQRVAGEDCKIKLRIFFNEEEEDYSIEELFMKTKIRSESTSHAKDTASLGSKATPSVDNELTAPSVGYMPIFNNALGRNVFVPYAVHGPAQHPSAQPQYPQPPTQPRIHVKIKNSVINSLNNVTGSIPYDTYTERVDSP